MSYKHRVLLRIPNLFQRRESYGYPSLLAVHLTTNEWGLKGFVWKGVRSKHGRHGKLEIRFGRGAGCRWGRSFFVAYGLYLAQAAQYAKDFPYHFWENIHFGRIKERPAKVAWQIGFTQNANQVPYVDGS